MCLVVGEKVDHAVGRLHVNGPDVLWPVVPEPAAFDHRRTRHAEVGIRVAMMTSQTPANAALPAKQRPLTIATDGTDPLRRAIQANECNCSRPGTACRCRPDGRRRPRRTTPTAPATDRRPAGGGPSSRGPGTPACPEDGVVVRHHADQRRLLAKVLGVDRSQTADDAVTRRVADQVVDISTAFLGGVHEAAVLLKAARVDKVCQVLTGGSTPAGVDLRDRLRPGLIIKQRSAGVVLREVGPLACSAVVGIVGGEGRSNRLLFQDRQNLPRLDDLTCRHANLGDHALRRCLHQPLDLHHLDDCNRHPGRHRITRLRPDLDDGAVGRSDDLVAHGRRVSRSHTRPTENTAPKHDVPDASRRLVGRDQPRRRVSSGSSRAALTLG